MSLDWQADVIDFHEKFCPERIGTTPTIPWGRINLLMTLIMEELDELDDAITRNDLPGVADAMGDLIYVTLGCATTCGIDLRPVWNAIQAANMAKAGGSNREDGKVMKPPGWRPPDIAAILANQGRLTR